MRVGWLIFLLLENDTGILQIGVEKSIYSEKFKNKNKLPLLAKDSYLVSLISKGGLFNQLAMT